MKYFFKTTLLSILILTSYPLYSQLKVESDFNREERKLNVKLTNKSPFIMLFMTEHLTNKPFISIECFDSQMNAIEWLRHPPFENEHDGPYLFKEMYVILKQNESYLLSFNIKPDKTKKKPKYFEVTYHLPHFLYDVENMENEKEFLEKRYKYLKDRQNFGLKEQFEFEKKCQQCVHNSEDVR